MSWHELKTAVCNSADELIVLDAVASATTSCKATLSPSLTGQVIDREGVQSSVGGRNFPSTLSNTDAVNLGAQLPSHQRRELFKSYSTNFRRSPRWTIHRSRESSIVRGRPETSRQNFRIRTLFESHSTNFRHSLCWHIYYLELLYLHK